MTPQDTMRLALEALEYHTEQTRPIQKTNEAIEALKAALAQQGEQQPVAWVDMEDGVPVERPRLWQDHTHGEVALYAAAPASQPDQRFTDLLCRIHRDGGHYIAEHGFDKAVLDADTKVAQLNAMSDAPADQTDTWIDDGGWEFPIERQIIQTR